MAGEIPRCIEIDSREVSMLVGTRPDEQGAREHPGAGSQPRGIFLQPAQRTCQIDLLAGEIGAEWVLREQSGTTWDGESVLEMFRGVAPRFLGDPISGVDLVGPLGGGEQFVLKTRVG